STSATYSLSLHDALPICGNQRNGSAMPRNRRWIIAVVAAGGLLVVGAARWSASARPVRAASGTILGRLGSAVTPSRLNVVLITRSEEHTSELQSHLNLVC